MFIGHNPPNLPGLIRTIWSVSITVWNIARHTDPTGRQRKMVLKILFATLIAVAILAPAAHADPAPQGSGQDPVVRTVFAQPTNVPGKSLETVTVSYPPGGKSAPHHHAKSAFIMAYVISGAIRSQLEGEPARVYHAGETWSEAPGAHHTISENASATEPAELLAVFLLDTGDSPLTIDDTAEK
jgi:quercetin dioxygenase-like cupin family protein